MSLTNKVVVVTGAGQGIGEGIALEFAEKGARVVVSDVNMDGVSKTVEKIKSAGGDCLGVKADVSSSRDVKAMIKKAVDHYSSLDVLVNNAGIVKPGPLESLSEEDWDMALNVNLKGAFLCSQQAAQVMIANRRGAIVNITSISAHEPYPGGGAYSPSKAAILMLTKQCAVEWAPYNIRVNAVSPGLIATPLTAKAYEDEEIKKGRKNMVPMGRIGRPKDIATVVALLASDETDYVTGVVIPVDGGFLRNEQKFLVDLGFQADSPKA
jgi:NAD(P)-dependent dehydrogenase (short-subunit alcohol dehydrogenase family)